jgi:CelD/BcsL family acetyltransferase involved in cellulose biosynthesis
VGALSGSIGVSVHGTIESIFRIEWRPLAELGSIAADWRALASRALEANVFYEPAFALAAAPVFGQGVGAGLVWSRSTPARLLGFFPARIERRRYGLPLPVLAGWMHAYAPFGAPLVDRDQGEAVLAAWLEHVAKDAQLPDIMLLPYLPTEGPLAQALDAVLARRGGQSAPFAPHRRALLAPAGERASYLDESIGHKKRKELRRQRKRLGDSGNVTSTSTVDPAGVSHALSDFFALEAAGWKGRAGTAARRHAEVAQFMTTAVAALAGEGKAQVARLSVDAQPIAALVTLRSAATAWCWKIAYDESYARFSPGVQILLDVTQALLDDPGLARADSCATADHPMIDHVWRERLALADRLLCVDPGRSIGFTVAHRLEALHRMAIDGAKALRDIIKRR